jgi:hypothetical protein
VKSEWQMVHLQTKPWSVELVQDLLYNMFKLYCWKDSRGQEFVGGASLFFIAWFARSTNFTPETWEETLVALKEDDREADAAAKAVQN